MGQVAIDSAAGMAPYEVGVVTIKCPNDGMWKDFICPVPTGKVTRIIGYGIADELLNQNTVIFAIDDLYGSRDAHVNSTSTGLKREIVFNEERVNTKNSLYFKPIASIKSTFTIMFICEDGKPPLHFPYY